MHEMSLCEGILQILEEQAREQNYQKIQCVWLEIGPLANVEVQALRFSFEVVTRGTLAEGARLEIEHPEAQAWCFPCGKTITISGYGSSCPVCGSHQLQVTTGEQLRIKQLEVI